MSAFTLLTLKTMSDARGALTVMDGILPFPVVRSFWIYGADGYKRGGHRHHRTRQALVALSGSVVVSMDDGKAQEEITLSSPDQCLLVEPRDWHEMTFGPGSILLVFASHGYDKDDYIDTPYERL
ncbi:MULTISPECIES: sugar 3,4-ketoisomerase [Rhizobium]|uniref:FdtA/QdtA family cupin domain-containing protein n=1 Tax=Rhizobium aouanii TaxID=3118145 RepID=A0ABU8CXH1_9HYPH|nr:FdtA/QdtA family cupin domain-containing protein [Rhizobium leguminosarum]MBY5797428.1 hypothetical protein [Rhizobium leguminosarum]TBY79783.1 hypothetical protein E0H51_00375 [Rhizobium leguminosarum bv. viciae]